MLNFTLDSELLMNINHLNLCNKMMNKPFDLCHFEALCYRIWNALQTWCNDNLKEILLFICPTPRICRLTSIKLKLNDNNFLITGYAMWTTHCSLHTAQQTQNLKLRIKKNNFHCWRLCCSKFRFKFHWTSNRDYRNSAQ